MSISYRGDDTPLHRNVVMACDRDGCRHLSTSLHQRQDVNGEWSPDPVSFHERVLGWVFRDGHTYCSKSCDSLASQYTRLDMRTPVAVTKPMIPSMSPRATQPQVQRKTR